MDIAVLVDFVKSLPSNVAIVFLFLLQVGACLHQKRENSTMQNAIAKRVDDVENKLVAYMREAEEQFAPKTDVALIRTDLADVKRSLDNFSTTLLTIFGKR